MIICRLVVIAIHTALSTKEILSPIIFNSLITFQNTKRSLVLKLSSHVQSTHILQEVPVSYLTKEHLLPGRFLSLLYFLLIIVLGGFRLKTVHE